MRFHSLSVPAVLALAIPPAFLAPDDSLAFGVEAKSKLTKTFETKVEIASENLSISIDGEDAHGGVEGPKIKIVDNEKIQVTDEYAAVADGRATKLVRHFDELAGDSVETASMPDGSGMEDREKKADKSSPLAGKTVVFVWKDDAYSADWGEDEQGDDELLEKLEADMDLVGFLPPKKVSDGDSWDLDAKLFNQISSPGGRLELKDQDDDRPEDKPPLQEVIEKNIGGEAKAVYKGSREVDGVKVGVIEITADLQSSGTVESEGGDNDVEYGVEYEGQLLWNLEAGRLHSLELKGKLQISMEIKREIEYGGESHELVEKIEFAGTIDHSASVD